MTRLLALLLLAAVLSGCTLTVIPPRPFDERALVVGESVHVVTGAQVFATRILYADGVECIVLSERAREPQIDCDWSGRKAVLRRE